MSKRSKEPSFAARKKAHTSDDVAEHIDLTNDDDEPSVSGRSHKWSAEMLKCLKDSFGELSGAVRNAIMLTA